jgi:hypothetical protein
MTDLSRDDAAELQELWLGPNVNTGSRFADREELRAAWERHRGVAMLMFGKLGRRPLAWWEFEAPPGLRYDDDHEQSILWAAGILGADERAELEAHWRRRFEQAYALDRKARRKRIRFADIPRELVAAWTAERKRRGRTIKRLAAEARKPAQEAAPKTAQEDAA